MTPQTQLTLSKVFDEKNIRAMELNGEIWVPVVDVADAWGVDRSTLTKIINRNPDVFKSLSTVVDVTSPKQISSNPETVNNSLRLVNERGMIVLGLKVSAGHIKNKQVKEKIIEFQLWVPELMQDIRKGLVQLTNPSQQLMLPVVQTPIDIINERLDVADIAVERSGVPKEIAHAIAWATEDSKEVSRSIGGYIKAQTKQLQLVETIQPLDQGEFDKHFSIRRLASHFGKTDDIIRNTLDKLTIINRSPSGTWHLTKHGEQFGKTFKVIIGYPYQNKEVTWIRYNPACVDLLKKYFDVQVPVAKVE